MPCASRSLAFPKKLNMAGAAAVMCTTPNFPSSTTSYADALHFALRIDTNKVPGELKKAWQMMEEEAVAKNNPSGFISQKPETRS